MENLIIKYPERGVKYIQASPLKAEAMQRMHRNPHLEGGRGWGEGYVWVCVCVQQQCLSLLQKERHSHESGLVLVFSPHPLLSCFLFRGGLYP